MSPEQESSFGTLLRRLREAAGMTQEELAFRAGLTPNAVGDLERGKTRRPYPHTVRSLADTLVVSSALTFGASSRLRVFAAFGSVSPAWPSARVSAPGASSSVSSVSGVASALAAGVSVSWWAGGLPLGHRRKEGRSLVL